MHPDKTAIYHAANDVTEQQKQEFKGTSELLIVLGKVERLTQAGAAQAIDNLAQEIAKCSLASAIMYPGQTDDEVVENDDVKIQLEQLDEIMETIPFASGIHPAIVDLMISERCDYWTDQLCEKIDADQIG